MIKAIETVYNGYRFRSRLEARWAVFFDALNIEYEYEKEGYKLTREPLSSIDYLPDFWLPQQDCWVEIKGEEPNAQEKSKAFYLALSSRKDVYIFFGNIHVPKEGEIQVYKYNYPDIWLEHPEHKKSKMKSLASLFADGEDIFYESSIPSDETIISIEDRLSINALDVISGTYQMGMSIRRQNNSLVLENIKENARSLLTPHILDNTDNLLYLLEGKEDWLVKVHQAKEKDAYMWLECDACEGFWIGRKYGYDTCHCSMNHGGCPDFDSSSLIAAYTAARQARFEHKK